MSNVEKELEKWRTILASNRIDVRFGNKAAKPALQEAKKKVKELESQLSR